MYIFVFLLIAGLTSAKHLWDGQPTNDENGVIVFVTRHIRYINQNPESEPHINNNFKQTNKNIQRKNNEQFADTTVKYNEVNNEDSLNNISDDLNDHRLRTNAYTTEAYSTTEYIVPDVNLHTNRNEQKYIAERNFVNRGVITSQVDEKNTRKVKIIPCNKTKSRPEDKTIINNNQERRNPKTNSSISNQNRLNERTNNVTNYTKESVNVQEIVTLGPISIPNKDREGNDTLPTTDTDESIWVWGTETNEKTTEAGSLDDRAAFTGDKCPTGQAKVKGICVDMH